MTQIDRKAHWEQVYAERSPLEVSWYQSEPALSLALIRCSGVSVAEPIVDVGGGASTLVDGLLAAGYQRVAVLDISTQALTHARRRLGAMAEQVEWYEADVTAFVPPQRFALWHDRAVFHFLTDEASRLGYRLSLERALLPGGRVIIAAFGIGGPTRCSNLVVVNHDAASIGAALGDGFQWIESVDETHVTPRGNSQLFGYHQFVRAMR